MRFLLILALLAAACLHAQAGWQAMGAGASLQTAEGISTLRYEIKRGQLAAAVMPVPAGLASMRAVRLRVRSDHDTPLAVLLTERGGGRYTAIFWSAANLWQQIELTPGDFALSDGPNDPPDPDGKLDLADVQAIALVDVAQVIAAAPDNSDFPAIIERRSGLHSLSVENPEILEGALAPPRAGVIDTFDRPLLSWMTMGGMSLQRSGADSPLHEPALQVSYVEKDDGFGILSRPLAALDLSGATALEFDIASDQEITLTIGFELSDKKRYNTTVYPPGKREVFHVKQRLSDFAGPGTLDPAKLKSLSLVDVSSVMGGAAAEKNTFWIGNIRVTR
jgi:hypothetical protein